MRDFTIADAESALGFLDANDRKLWVEMAFAMKGHFGDEGFDVWDRWSQTSGLYTVRAARTAWRSAKEKVGGTGIGSLIYLAKQAGWVKSEQANGWQSRPRPASSFSSRPAPNPAKVAERIWKAWEGSSPIVPVIPRYMKMYLQWRGIGGLTPESIGQNVRFHPELEYFEEDVTGKMVLQGTHPAMLLAYRAHGGELVTLHRMYLSKTGGKAAVAEPKKMMPVPGDRSLSGAAVMMPGRFGQGSGIYHVAEGWETAASVLAVYDMPTFSVGSTALLEKFNPPSDCKVLFIWGDKDRSKAGETAAERLRESMLTRGVPSFCLYPRESIPAGSKGLDWNDVLLSLGIAGFPTVAMMNEVVTRALGGRKAV